MNTPSSILTASKCSPFAGFGLGLRTEHYPDFEQQRQPLDWLEILTDNYLVEGGKPLKFLDQFRQDYPMAMHGVGMSIGSANGLNLPYLHQVKQLAQRVEPLWVSDHLCWTGWGQHVLHDLYPLPYTDEAAQLVIAHMRQAQDILQRRLVLENVSSYIDFVQSSQAEWQFLSHIANEADCLLLVDINNIYVSSVNHGFDPLTYLRALPAHRIQQIHLAGHTSQGSQLIDTHDQPVCPAVWQLFAQAVDLWPPVATMIERDDHMPPLPDLLAELQVAKNMAQQGGWVESASFTQQSANAPTPTTEKATVPTPLLTQTQATLAQYWLDANDDAIASEHLAAAQALIKTPENATRQARLDIYQNAYRVRLRGVVADTFEQTAKYLGTDLFDALGLDFVLKHPCNSRSLNRYGQAWPSYLQTQYPNNPELHELAQLEWDLRTRFDGADIPCLTPEHAAQASPPHAWLHQTQASHPSLIMRASATNAFELWQALSQDAEVPEPMLWQHPMHMLVWRQNWQPMFQMMGGQQAELMQGLCNSQSITQLCEQWNDAQTTPQPADLGIWLQQCLQQGWLALT
jgi:uncharacterized protein (UPF0276 family)